MYGVLAQCYQRREDWQNAAINYEQTVSTSRDPSFSTYYNLGNALQHISRHRDAERAYEQAIRKNPEHVQAKQKLKHIRQMMSDKVFLELCSVHDLNQDFEFLLNSKVDHIQSFLRKGQFYEIEELQLLSTLVKAPKHILDVGANIGNHSIYFAHCFNPEIVVPVEPNPLITSILKANLGLNWHPSFDLSLVGTGFSDRVCSGKSVTASEANIGGAKLQHHTDGLIPITTADLSFPHRTFDLIKIDVEGMELAVISGMSQVLSRSNAIVFLEVLIPNIDNAISLMNTFGYEYNTYYQRYGRCINLIFKKGEK